MVSNGSTVQLADPFLGSLIEQLDAIFIDARALTDGLSSAQFNWQPEPHRWSIGQCLDHLTRTVHLYPDEIERMIAEARGRQSTSRPYREGWLSRWIVESMEPPPRMRIRTKRTVEPGMQLDRDATVRDFEAAFRQLQGFIVAADGVSLRHGRMRSPFAPVLRFTLGQVLAMNLAHARRHLWQARQVRQHPKFPV
ncbi:MAG TPA: DinB family protein [Longimicrobiales bacterium]|nr:DinB family protein [Longimicrobiales bacterium]